MRIRIGRRRKIQFTDKKHPMMGIVSMLISFVSLAWMIGLFVGSSMVQGQGSIAYGYMGIFNMLLALAGFILSLQCYKKDDAYMTTPTIGSVINGIIVIIYLILYFLGVI
jgi:hypothetical protein